MTKIKIDAQILKNVAKFMQDCEEVRFEFSDDGIHSVMMDPSHVSMFIIHIPMEICEEYTLTDARALNIDIDEFKKTIAKAKEAVEIEFDEGRILVQHDNVSYEMAQIEIMLGEKYKKPTLSHTAEALIESSILSDAMAETKNASESMKIEITENELKFSAEGDIFRLIEVVHEKNTDNLYNLTGAAVSAFNTAMIPTLPPGQATLKLGTDVPLQIDVESAGLGNYTYILAPRVERE